MSTSSPRPSPAKRYGLFFALNFVIGIIALDFRVLGFRFCFFPVDLRLVDKVPDSNRFVINKI